MDDAAYRAWYSMTAREQAVWGAAYAHRCLAGASALESAASAEAAITALRGADVDTHIAGPETELARLGIQLSLDEFVPWYRVAARLDKPASRQQTPDDAACQSAFERYQRGRTDFY